MYSYEIETYLGERKFYFESFYEFQKIVDTSSQVHYSLIEVNDKDTVLKVFTDDSYEWIVYIKK